MPRQNMPENWDPPFPAWSADFDGTSSLAIAYCGVQSQSSNTDGSEAAYALLQSGPDAPNHVERGRFTDAAGFVNQVFVLYWREPSAYERFAEQSAFARWLADDALLMGDIGVWFEAFHIPTTHFQTLFSSQSPAGAARLTNKPMVGPVTEHGYWGSMRDRMPASDSGELSSSFDNAGRMSGPTETRGRRLVLAAPENLCLIRSAQDWSSCRGDERDSYLREVHPVLMKGMKFLSESPTQTRCLSCRFIDQLTDEGDPSHRSFAMAYFLDMAHLEAWSKSHPTHLAIFESFISLAERLGNDVALRLWHEVAALDAVGARLEYINCHERTGLLPYASIQGFGGA